MPVKNDMKQLYACPKAPGEKPWGNRTKDGQYRCVKCGQKHP